MRLGDLLARRKTPHRLSRAAYKRLLLEVGPVHYLWEYPDGSPVEGKPHVLEDLECCEELKLLEAYEEANGLWAAERVMRVVDLGIVDLPVRTTHDVSSWDEEDFEREEEAWEHLRRVTGQTERHEAAKRVAEQPIGEPEPFFEAPQTEATEPEAEEPTEPELKRGEVPMTPTGAPGGFARWSQYQRNAWVARHVYPSQWSKVWRELEKLDFLRSLN